MSSADRYFIWSNQHRAWWGRNRRGYTTVTLNAGVYSHDEAEVICAAANYRPGICNEVAVLAPQEWEAHSFYGREADAFANLREGALGLSPKDQFTLATILAQNVGYDLVVEAEHPESPHRVVRAPSSEVAKAFRDLGDAIEKWFDIPTPITTEHPPCQFLAPVSASADELDQHAAAIAIPGQIDPTAHEQTK
jgi:hypothetical protein